MKELIILFGAISGVMAFARRLVEHLAAIHFGAFANNLSSGTAADDHVGLSAFGVPLPPFERGALYEMAAYGNIGSTNSSYGIYSQYSLVRNKPTGVLPGQTNDRISRAEEFKLEKIN
ncbi:hypothetical protein LZZ85_18965 [Terrimonas sp. NA20]|uniref:Uncharacterized protein n=1 Tax=Terrimonas ginsenosidimutans TaxID=2908004 RepID=A0ABS9KVX6_9BACT|nr:hypothetical protein [Terrimonas ginsenosidimutans]MCG2616389.1 hypothetical protein [Terrimonas ginsenosidimutans]